MSNINLMQGTSVNTLFSSFSNTQSKQNADNPLSFLRDYISIRNGSYQKLLNAYYNIGSEDKPENTKKETIATTKDSVEKLTDLQKKADSLTKTTKELYSSGEDSVFHKKDIKQEDGTTKKDYDKDAIYKKVKDFVKNYNEFLDASEEVSSTTVKRTVSNLKSATEFNKKFLSEVGIEVKEDGSLSLDEKKFKDSSMGKVESVFKGIGTYGYQVSVRADRVEEMVKREATRANTYNQYGNYNKNYNYSYQDYM